jgi:hypothetical protein
MQKITCRLILLALSFGLVNCGGSDNTVRISQNGVVSEVNAQSTYCEAGPPTGGISGVDGFLSSPLICSIQFQTDGYFSDFFAFTVSDVNAAYQQLQRPLLLGGGLVQGTVTISGQPQAIYEGIISFSRISNRSGDEVCAEYYIQAGFYQVEGHFCSGIQNGY